MRALALALLWLLTRDGVVHRLDDGVERGAVTVDGARALTALPGGRFVVATRGQLVIADGAVRRTLPLAGDVDALAAVGDQVAAATDRGKLSQIDLRQGRARALAPWRSGPIAADGDELFVVHDGAVEQLGGRRWPITGHARALAAGGGRLFVATSEGPLWEIDRASGRQRDLGLGGWWGTVALVATTDGTRLYVVTQAGKLWEIDPVAGTKRILAMSGWSNALALAVGR